jgi:hypothetical protein
MIRHGRLLMEIGTANIYAGRRLTCDGNGPGVYPRILHRKSMKMDSLIHNRATVRIWCHREKRGTKEPP